MEITFEDLKFLSTIVIAGMRPAVFQDQGMAQWDLAGLNYNDRCFQAVLQENEGKKMLVIQVLRRGSQGCNLGEYRWIPLDTVLFNHNDDTKEKVIRTIKRWSGMQEERDGIFRPKGVLKECSFKVWLEAVGDVSITQLAKDYFATDDLQTKLSVSKIHGFLALRSLSNKVSADEIRAVKEAISNLKPKEKDRQTIDWLIRILGEETY